MHNSAQGTKVFICTSKTVERCRQRCADSGQDKRRGSLAYGSHDSTTASDDFTSTACLHSEWGTCGTQLGSARAPAASLRVLLVKGTDFDAGYWSQP